MPQTRTFVDTNVLIAALLDVGPTGDAAEDVLLDPDRVFVASDFLRLELLPKPAFHKQQRHRANSTNFGPLIYFETERTQKDERVIHRKDIRFEIG